MRFFSSSSALCTTLAMVVWAATSSKTALAVNVETPSLSINKDIDFNEDDHTRSLQSSRCGCSSCSSAVLGRDAGGFPVGDRIDWVKNNLNKSESRACKMVCGDEFPSVCGSQCDPTRCSSGGNGNGGCSNSPSNWHDSDGSKFNCAWYAQDNNCQRYGGKYANRGKTANQACCACGGGSTNPQPSPSPPSPSPPSPSPPSGGGGKCGCNSCSSTVLNRDAGGHKVGDRIDWLEANMNMSEQQACETVCGSEFPGVCEECNPGQCGSNPNPNPNPNPSPNPPSPSPPTGTCSGSRMTFVNRANKSVWIYNFPYGAPAPRQPIKGRAIANGEVVCVPLSTATFSMRVYVADKRLTNSLERGVAIDGGNPSVDGGVMFSFFEYGNEPNQSRYTVDLSYIDEFSYPLTVKFKNVGSYGGAIEGHEYGPKSMSRMRSALAQQTDFSWSALIWPLNGGSARWHNYPPMSRIVGPLKAWQWQTGSSHTDINNFTPTSFSQFYRTLPKTGRQLFGSLNRNNWDGWNFLNQRQPSNTGYVRALHSVSQPDSRGKYGFFCYPIDNVDGEFTWLPSSVRTTVTIYPYNS